MHIHPFLEGNGRTSRLLSTLCLYRSSYAFKRLFTLSEFYDLDRAAFYRALQSERERNMNLTGWIEFFLHGLTVQMAEVKTRGERVIRRDVLVRKHRLNEPQAVVVEALVEGDPLGIEEVEAVVPGVNRRTLQRDLRGLVEAEIAPAEGAARATRYSLSDKWLR